MKKHSVITVLLIILSFSSCLKEDDKTNEDGEIKTTGNTQITGLEFVDDSEYGAIPESSVPIYGGSAPSNFSLNFPPPIWQGEKGSCVSFAVAYGVMSYYMGGPWANGEIILGAKVASPEYTFNQTAANNCKGSRFVSSWIGGVGILDLLKDKGVCTWAEMPYEYNLECSAPPSSSQNTAALKNKIERYEKVTNLSESNIKSILLQEKPIVFGANVNTAFASIDANYIWTQKLNGSGHAMVIIGYDDSKDAFKIHNSWGKGWGDNGYTWMKYSAAEDIIKEAYVIYPKIQGGNNNNNTGGSCSVDSWGYVEIGHNFASEIEVFINKTKSLTVAGTTTPDMVIPAWSTRYKYNVPVGTHTYQITTVGTNFYTYDQGEIRIDNPCDTFKIRL